MSVSNFGPDLVSVQQYLSILIRIHKTYIHCTCAVNLTSTRKTYRERERANEKRKGEHEMIRCPWWKTTRSWMKPVGLGFDGWLQQECQHHFAGCHSVKGVFIKPSSPKREGSVGSLTQLFLLRKAPWCSARSRWSESWHEGLHSSLVFPHRESSITLYMQKCGKMLVMNAGKMRDPLPNLWSTS